MVLNMQYLQGIPLVINLGSGWSCGHVVLPDPWECLATTLPVTRANRPSPGVTSARGSDRGVTAVSSKKTNDPLVNLEL